MGKDKRAAIEFDGEFVQQSTGRFVLKTEGNPYMFIALPNKRLYVKQVKAEVTSSVLLAEDVIQVDAVRGFYSTELDIDLGLTVVYMKSDHKVYTRNYVTVGNSREWTDEKLIDSNSDNVSIQAFRMQDFRSAVFVEGSNRIYLSPKPDLPN